MTVKQWDNETDSTPNVNVYLYKEGDESYWMVEIDTPIIEGQIDNTRVYVNDRLVRGW